MEFLARLKKMLSSSLEKSERMCLPWITNTLSQLLKHSQYVLAALTPRLLVNEQHAGTKEPCRINFLLGSSFHLDLEIKLLEMFSSIETQGEVGSTLQIKGYLVLCKMFILNIFFSLKKKF